MQDSVEQLRLANQALDDLMMPADCCGDRNDDDDKET
jgi:hypothetical protein